MRITPGRSWPGLYRPPKIEGSMELKVTQKIALLALVFSTSSIALAESSPNSQQAVPHYQSFSGGSGSRFHRPEANSDKRATDSIAAAKIEVDTDARAMLANPESNSAVSLQKESPAVDGRSAHRRSFSGGSAGASSMLNRSHGE